MSDDTSTSADPAPPPASRWTWGLLRQFTPFFAPYRLQIAIALAFLLLAAAAALSFPVALRFLIDGGLSAAAQTASSSASSTAPNLPTKSASSIGWYFLMLFAVAVCMALFSAARYYMVTWVGERVTADIRNAVYDHVIRLSPAFFERTPSGEVLSRITTDTTLIQSVVGSSLSLFLRNSIMGLGALVALIYTNPWLMLQIIVGIVVILAPIFLLGKRIRKLSRASQDRIADSSAIASEVMHAIPLVQSYNAQSYESERFAQSTEHAFATAIRRTQVRAALIAFMIGATAAGLLWGLYQGVLGVMEGSISAGELGQTVFFVMMLASSVAVLGEVYGELLRAAGASERLLELLHTKSDIPDAPAQLHTANTSNKADATNAHNLVFDGVHFAYPSRPDTAALTDFSLHIPAGHTVAIVGSSGAGKSTLMQLLLRFYDPQRGRIAINGNDIRRYSLHDLRDQLGLVAQEAVLFSGTIADNIRYGNTTAPDDAVEHAAQQAHAWEFITELPQGIHTHIGEKGVRLSGGQRQRIAIARALLKNPPILLLDEATSALDAHNEQAVQRALDTAMQGRTTLVIAHRLATIQKADRIIVLERGRIVESGSHQELLEAQGTYAHMVALQQL